MKLRHLRIPLAIILPTLAAPAFAASSSALGDMTSFEVIARDTLQLVDRGDMKAAEKRITDFEGAWDKAEASLYPRDKASWSVVDDAADAAISSLRAATPDRVGADKSVSALVDTLHDPSAH